MLLFVEIKVKKHIKKKRHPNKFVEMYILKYEF